MKRHVIKPHRPYRSLIIVLILTGAVGLGVFALSASERRPMHDEIERLRDERDSLASTLAMARDRNAELLERVAILERAQQVESKAYADVNQHLRSLQDEVLTLKEEVAFYRGIVSSDKETGLNIQTFVVDKDKPDGYYRFQLVLTQHLKKVRQISGTVKLSVTSASGNRSHDLLLVDVAGRQTQELPFEFKHFQRLEGRFSLPDGFSPQRLLVHVSATGKPPSNIEKGFDWQSLAS